MVAIVASEHRAEHRFTFLIGKTTIRVEVVDGHAQIGTTSDVTREGETDVVLVEVGNKPFFVRNGGVGGSGVIVFHLLRCDNVWGVCICKDEVRSLLSCEIDA